MTDWLHCNACFCLHENAKSSFFISRCGHIYCSSCNNKALKKGSCLVCNTANLVTIDILTNELPENIRLFFVPGDKVQAQLIMCIEEMRKQCDTMKDILSRLLECTKITEFQKANSFRLLAYCREKIKHIERLEANERIANEKISDLERRLKMQQSEIDDLKKSQQNNRMFPSIAYDGDKNRNSFFDLPSPQSHVAATPTFNMKQSMTQMYSPSDPKQFSESSRSALRAIANVVQANSANNQQRSSTSFITHETRKSNNSPAPQNTQRLPESRVTIRPSNSSPAPPSSGRIAVAAFQGKTRHEYVPMTPGTVFSDSCSIGSAESPLSGVGVVSTVAHRRPGSVVAPSPLVNIPRTPDSTASSDHYGMRLPLPTSTRPLIFPASSNLPFFKQSSARPK